MDWCRLWHDMPNDPKFRRVATLSGRPMPEVLAVFLHMMTNASANATERGELDGWCDDDIGAALDMSEEAVAAIREAMQGKLLDGARLTGWSKRQPKREDGAAERAKVWRERKKAQETAPERTRTQPNAEERPDKIREDIDKNTPPSPSGTLPPKAARKSRLKVEILPDEWRAYAEAKRPDLDPLQTFEGFRDYWIGKGDPMADWLRVWQRWVRETRSRAPPPVRSGVIDLDAIDWGAAEKC